MITTADAYGDQPDVTGNEELDVHQTTAALEPADRVAAVWREHLAQEQNNEAINRVVGRPDDGITWSR